MTAAAEDFAAQIVRWQRSHGRHTLPWQNTTDPYRVWLSEIMLQQTQVATVLGYYQRFLQRFPDVRALAAAPADDVMGLWSGLGYYSRARNLHACAQQVVALHGGEFPRSAALLQTLPGIGRSTAAAIASFCFGERVAILDANVKRVLTRVLGFGGDLASVAQERALWAEATALLPRDDGVEGSAADAMPRYTQGLMDLGATVCLPRKPLCLLCPAASLCVARREGLPERYPVKTRTLRRSAQSLWLLWTQAPDGSVWLVRRPAPGIWAGLHCLPVFDSADALEAAVPPAQRALLQYRSPLLHTLTHKDLHLHPVRLVQPAGVGQPAAGVAFAAAAADLAGTWVAADSWAALGLPAPIRRLLETA